MLKRTILAAVCALGTVPAAAQSDFPNRPIKIVVPFTAGGGTDILTRIVGNKMSELLGKAIVVENRAGGNTLIATEVVAQAPADGYTLLMQTNNFTVNATFYEKLSYDTVKDFAPISLVASNPHLLVVTNSLPAKNLAEFVAYAKAHPGDITFGTAGSGTVNHLAGELLKISAQIDMTHVPYRGSGSLLGDLASGQIKSHFAALPVVIGHLRGGTMRAIAWTTPMRHPALPDVPTINEAGFPDYADFRSWFGLLAPAKTPPEVIAKLSDAVMTAGKHPDVVGKLPEYWVHASTPQEFAAFIKDDIDKAAKLIKASGAKID